MREQGTAPAEASAPDRDRVAPGAPPAVPDWLIRILALLILCTLEIYFSLRDATRRPARRTNRPASAIGRRAANDAMPGAAADRAGRNRAIAPEAAEAAKFVRRVRALFTREEVRSGSQQPQAQGVARQNVSRATCAVRPASGSPRRAAGVPHRAPPRIPPGVMRATPPTSWLRMFARAATTPPTGPPTGPPALAGRQFCLV